jgi:late competence protein required for DNA uptake (superfamily II DNA/RNA helicase)
VKFLYYIITIKKIEIMGNFKMKIEKKVGKRTYEFTVEGENLHEAVIESKKLSFYDVHKCGCCGSDDLVLDAHVAQDKFSYTTVKCNGCRASVNFGQQQKDDTIFYLRTRDKADGTGKEIDWKEAPATPGQAPQQVAQQQVQNYAQQPNNGQQGQ